MQDLNMAGFVPPRQDTDAGPLQPGFIPKHTLLATRGATRRLGASYLSHFSAPEPVAEPALTALHQPAYLELDIAIDPAQRALWCYMKPNGPPSFTPSMVRELNRLHLSIRHDNAVNPASNPLFYVMGSRLPGIYNLGGDLAFLVDRIRAGDRAALTRYAHGCVHAVHAIHTGFDLPMVSIGLVEGNALGGGLEGALCFHVLVAERGVKMGFPEVLFGSFPGMGAYSFLSRKLGPKTAERMILDGRIYSSEDFYEMGIVDVLAPKGEGKAVVQRWMEENRRRQPLIHAMNKVRERVNPVPLQELCDVTDIWVETAMALDASDLRRMERLEAAQRRTARGPG